MNDLHIHTTESDGSLTVSEVMEIAASKGIQTLALTDHETMRGVSEAMEIGKGHGMRVIPGVELVTAFQGREVHLLGYFNPDSLENTSLQSRLKELREQRTDLAYEMVRKLQKDGYGLKWSEVEQVANPHAAVSKGHIMRALHEHKNGKMDWPEIAQLFQRNGVAYLPFLEHPIEEAIDLIYQCGGVPVLAHPGLLRDLQLVTDILDRSKIGLEVYYGYWVKREELIEIFAQMAQEKALLTTGGSDFHALGGVVNMGDIEVPEKCVTSILAHLED